MNEQACKSSNDSDAPMLLPVTTNARYIITVGDKSALIIDDNAVN